MERGVTRFWSFSTLPSMSQKMAFGKVTGGRPRSKRESCPSAVLAFGVLLVSASASAADADSGSLPAADVALDPPQPMVGLGFGREEGGRGVVFWTRACFVSFCETRRP